MINWLTIIAACIPVPIIIGAVLVRMGRWPKRIGDEPHCAKCDYLLVGLSSDRCPECGTALSPKTIVHGQRNRRPGLIAIGGLFISLGLLLAILLATGMARNVDWYQYKPTSLVIGDLESGSAQRIDRAWTELRKRETANTISKAQIRRIVALAIKEQTSPAPISAEGVLLDFADRMMARGLVDADQQTKLLEQAFQPTLSVRKTVTPGNSVPFSIPFNLRTPSKWEWKLTYASVSIDGGKKQRLGTSISDSGGIRSIGAGGYPIPVSGVGDHDLNVAATIEFRLTANGTVAFRKDFSLDGKFKVDDKPESSIQLINDPTIAQTLRASIEPRGFVYDSSSHKIIGQFKIESSPSNIGFDVVARFNGHEEKLTPITARKRSGGDVEWTGTFSDQQVGSPPATVDIILRSSEKAAASTIDLYDIWQGELIFPNVPIIVPTPTTQR